MSMDRINITNLLVRGIVGINPDERTKPQDVLVNVTMLVDTTKAAVSDSIDDAVNYRTVAKAMISHIEQGEPMLLERLAAELVQIAFDSEDRIEEVQLKVEKPGALRFAESVGVTIKRKRSDA
ncbi:MAG: dihydroneopterin aldolase [Acidimicrobiia bacterium]|nr:dihydroneopterin aldolase [Acidimicrobiia bacterium]